MVEERVGWRSETSVHVSSIADNKEVTHQKELVHVDFKLGVVGSPDWRQ